MRRTAIGVVTAVAWGMLAAGAAADFPTMLTSFASGPAGPDCGPPLCEAPCGGICGAGCYDGGIVFQAEALFFKYHRADGVRAGSFNNVPPNTTDDISFPYTATPRITLGYITNSGLGMRLRYWEYDQAGEAVFPSSGVAMGVDTYTIDLELFERLQIGPCWTLELSGGVRYNEFEEVMIDPIPDSFRSVSFNGWGGIIGLEATRSLGRWGGLYGRARCAILHGDKLVQNFTELEQAAILRDTTLGMTELAIGYEYNRVLPSGALLVARAGYEWQNWHNYSMSFTPFTTAPANQPAQFAGPSDVGFSGPTLLLGIEY